MNLHPRFGFAGLKPVFNSASLAERYKLLYTLRYGYQPVECRAAERPAVELPLIFPGRGDKAIESINTLSDYLIRSEPYYRPTGRETELFLAAARSGLPVLLKGPTGCGKTRFLENMAWRLGRPLLTVAGHEDLTASDLIGRWLFINEETVWMDGPLTRAARHGAICYLDEVVEARQDTTVAIHSLTDHRRLLALEKKSEVVRAHPDFMLVLSYNPGYQSILKELKASTRQRFVALDFDYPAEEDEVEIAVAETGLDRERAALLVRLARRMRGLKEYGLEEGVSTRLVIYAARLAADGLDLHLAVEAAMISPVTDDEDLKRAMFEVAREIVPPS